MALVECLGALAARQYCASYQYKNKKCRKTTHSYTFSVPSAVNCWLPNLEAIIKVPSASCYHLFWQTQLKTPRLSMSEIYHQLHSFRASRPWAQTRSPRRKLVSETHSKSSKAICLSSRDTQEQTICK